MTDSEETLIDMLAKRDKEIAELKVFVNNVKGMRQLQVEYFKNRNSVILQEAKSMESFVDHLIIRFKEIEDGQTSLLDQLEEDGPTNEKGMNL